jgi:hypothetical protein
MGGGGAGAGARRSFCASKRDLSCQTLGEGAGRAAEEEEGQQAIEADDARGKLELSEAQLLECRTLSCADLEVFSKPSPQQIRPSMVDVLGISSPFKEGTGSAMA